MCFKVTRAQREYYRYQGLTAELERRGLGSSRPELAWANRQEKEKWEKVVVHRNDRVNLESDDKPESDSTADAADPRLRK